MNNPALTNREVEALNIYSVNETKLYFEDGIDYELWKYFPSQGTLGEPSYHAGYFTDGHDHGFECCHREPVEGWVPEKGTLEIPVSTAVGILRDLQKAQDLLRAVSDPKRREDREQARLQVLELLRTVGESFSGRGRRGLK